MAEDKQMTIDDVVDSVEDAEVKEVPKAEIAEVNQTAVAELNNATNQITSAFANTENFKSMYVMAQNLAKSDIIPQSYQNKPMNVMIALDTAQRMNVSPLFVMEECSIIRGKRSWSGKACLQLIRNCKRFEKVKINWVGKDGDDSYGAYVSAIDKATGEEIKGATVTMGMAKKEGWTSNPKWSSLKELMISYRSGAFFARVYCPDMLNGYVEGELEDIEYGSRVKTDNPF